MDVPAALRPFDPTSYARDRSATFDGSPANLLYTSDSQINLQVSDLGSKTSANLVVTVDGTSSVGLIVPLAPAWPSVFANGILNQDKSRRYAYHMESGSGIGSVLS
jgi:uncharacterized protein (TIGR03437 family)